MTLQIGRFTPYHTLAAGAVVTAPVPSAAPVAPAVAEAVVAGVDAAGAVFGAVPPVPTPEARQAVERAAERVQQLRAQGRELHFEHDDIENRVIIQVRDLDGNVLQTIPPSKAMDIMAGGDL